MWALNRSFDLLVQALETVEDLEGVVAGWSLAHESMESLPGSDAKAMALVWAALATVASSVLAAREEKERGNT